MENSRDNLGRFVKGRKLSIEEEKKRLEGMKKHYEKFIPSAKLRKENPYIFNSWRAMLYTQKGKKAGCSEESWRTFENFFNDVTPTYEKGLVLRRVDSTLPFSKENFIWVTTEQASVMDSKSRMIYLDYNGEHLSLKELALKYNQSVAGIRARYFNNKGNYTTEEIIFGKQVKRGNKQPRNAISSTEERVKASKMIQQYKVADKKHGHEICDITTEYMIENILHKPCVYCGDIELIGCDRIDNDKGHIKGNIVPCCYGCNIARNNTFTYEEMLRLGKTIKQIKEDRKKKMLNL